MSATIKLREHKIAIPFRRAHVQTSRVILSYGAPESDVCVDFSEKRMAKSHSCPTVIKADDSRVTRL